MQANITAKGNLSMFVQWNSASMRDLDAKAMGCLSWGRQVVRPLLNVSACTVLILEWAYCQTDFWNTKAMKALSGKKTWLTAVY